MSRAIYALLVAESFMTCAAPAFAADLAPLPDGYTSGIVSTIPGLYAHAINFHDAHELDQSMRAADTACFARGRRLEYLGQARRDMSTQYWLYRSGNDTVVFESSHIVKIDVDLCQVTFIETRKISRSIEKAGGWPLPFAGGRGCSRFAKNCYQAEKFGIKERCHAEGNGFQLTRYCVSVERGPSRGLLIESVYESDDMSGHGFQVTDLKSDVSLDASLFDRSRVW